MKFRVFDRFPPPRAFAVRFTGILLMLLAGCSSIPRPPDHQALPADINIPAHAELLGHSSYSGPDQYGPAALAFAFSYTGKAVTPLEAAELVNLPASREATEDEMLTATRQMGLLPYVLDGKLGDVLKEVAAGHPVIVLRDFRYAVLTGYDLAKRQVVLEAGPNSPLVMSLHDFEVAWSGSGRWAFVAMDPAVLPATARENSFMEAAAGLEQVVPEAARAAYEAALLRWPNDLAARLGLGNVAYSRFKLKEAEAEYALATVEHPDSGDAWNDLALVLHDEGRNREALFAIIRAVSIGGERSAEYASTMRAIQNERHWDEIQ